MCRNLGGLFFQIVEAVSKPPLGLNIFVELEVQSSKYFNIFLRLPFFALLDLEPN